VQTRIKSVVSNILAMREVPMLIKQRRAANQRRIFLNHMIRVIDCYLEE